MHPSTDTRQAIRPHTGCGREPKGAPLARVSVPCPGCGQRYWFKIPMPVRPGLVVTVTCTVRHCGSDVPVYASDVQKKAA